MSNTSFLVFTEKARSGQKIGKTSIGFRALTFFLIDQTSKALLFLKDKVVFSMWDLEKNRICRPKPEISSSKVGLFTRETRVNPAKLVLHFRSPRPIPIIFSRIFNLYDEDNYLGSTKTSLIFTLLHRKRYLLRRDWAVLLAELVAVAYVYTRIWPWEGGCIYYVRHGKS